MSTGMTVSGMTKDVTCTMEHILVMSMIKKNQRINLMIKKSQRIKLMIMLMMVILVQVSENGSSAILQPLIICAKVLRCRNLPTMIAIGMVRTARTNFGLIATGQNKIAHGCKGKIKTGSEDTRKAMKEDIGMVYS